MRRTNLVVDVRVGDKLDLGGVVQVELVHKSGRMARLRVTAPREIRIETKQQQEGDKPVASMAN